MDSSSRKIVAIVAIITLTVMAVMAGNFFADSGASESTAAVEPPEPRNDSAEAAISAGATPNAGSEFSSDIPKAEDIPAIDGKPSMTFENDSSNDTPVAQESTKGIATPSSNSTTPERVK